MTTRAGEPPAQADAQLGERVAALVERAIQLDSRFRIPLIGVRVGWDPIISAIPVVGDLAMAVVAAGLIREAQGMGVGRDTLTRMAVNVGIDFAVGMVPFVGPIFDVFFRANVRNAQLVTDDLAAQRLRASPRR